MLFLNRVIETLLQINNNLNYTKSSRQKKIKLHNESKRKMSPLTSIFFQEQG